MLEDTSYANVVGWSASGKSFIVWVGDVFANSVFLCCSHTIISRSSDAHLYLSDRT